MKFPNILTLILTLFRRPAPQPEPVAETAALATDVMVDLETFGTQASACIPSIGAVGFDQNGMVPYAKFYITGIDIQTCLDAGLTIDGETQYWWMKQSEEARKEISRRPIVEFNEHGELILEELPRPTLQEALEEFAHFIDTQTVGRKHVRIWGNGSDFDNVILANAYRAMGMETPWEFWNNRCYRTLKNQYRHITLERTGTHHSAYDDAHSQAEHCIRLLAEHEHGLKLLKQEQQDLEDVA
ncbi:3'-5' exonuclease [Marinobacterium stanieri]|uniref:3'-5' exonuclease n=1 Tax=Marinobacterium stanieri TaxID=49186 RepID=UPI000255A5D5|nr:3'-5' exonuclease [Marinobacterium stanieri]